MTTIIAIMMLGIITGYLLRHKRLRCLDNVMTASIWVLLFLLGVQAGGDEKIVRWIGSLGLEALVISVGGVTGSCLFAMLLWKYSYRKGRQEGGESER